MKGPSISHPVMGNYMAGYAAGYSDWPVVLFLGVRAAGMLFTIGSKEDWSDSGSAPDIWSGAVDGYEDFKRDHPDRHLVRKLLWHLRF